MPISTTYTDARANFAKLWDRLEQDRDLLVIERRGHETMAMLPMAEVEALLEAAHLLRSPENARRLLRSLQRALDDEARPGTRANWPAPSVLPERVAVFQPE